MVFLYYEDEVYKSLPINKQIDYHSLRRLIESFIYSKENPITSSTAIKSEIIQPMKDHPTFVSNCLQKEYCVILILGKKFSDDSANKDMFDKLEAVSKNIKDPEIHYNWIDGECQSNFIEKFFLYKKDIPSIVFLFPFRNTYAKFGGVRDPYLIEHFIKSTKEYRFPIESVKASELIIENKECDSIEEDLEVLDVDFKEEENYKDDL